MAEPTTASSPVLSGWINQRKLFWLAGGLAMMVLLVGVAFILYARHEIKTTAATQIALYAKLLEQQTSADISAIEATVRSVSQRIDIQTEPGSPQLSTRLTEVIQGRPQLRSLSLLDSNGRVLHSSSPGNLDVIVDLSLLGNLPEVSTGAVLGPSLKGRDLSALQSAAKGVGQSNVLPLLQRFTTAADETLTLVALININHFSAQYGLIFSDPSIRVALLSYAGALLTATDNVALESGVSLRHLPAFTTFLPLKESGNTIGAGLLGDEVISSFRTTRRWPVVVLVEKSYETTMSAATLIRNWTLAGVFLLWLAILAPTLVLARRLRHDAALNARLQSANLSVIASESRLRATLASSIDGVLSIDESGRIIAFNPAAEKIFGRTCAEVMGQPMEEFLVPSHLRHEHQAGLKQFVENHEGPVLKRLNKHMETVGMRRDGKPFPLELTIVSTTNENQVFFTATVRDITEKKLIEAEKAGLLIRYKRLSVDLERQKMALDQHAVVSIMNADESIVYANDKLVETSGFSREELIGKKYYQLRRQLDTSVYADLRASLAAGQIWHGELVMRRRNGGSYWATCTLVPIPGDDGRPRQWINIETDISAQRETEIALQDARLRELETGTRIQQTLLSANPSQPLPGLWLSAYNQASKGVDGDFLDVIRIGEHCVDILAGDVMGKGVPAALMGAATKLQFSRSIAELLTLREDGGELPRPSAIVAAVHQAMTRHLQTLEAFVTLVYIRIDSLRNVITWIGCGHEETMVLRGLGGFELLPNQHPPLGILEHQDFRQDEIPLAVGDAVFLCSDGLTDAVVGNSERVGRDALNQAVKRVVQTHPTPAAALHSLRRQVLHGEVQVVDDITMVLLMRTAVHDFETRCELPIDLGSLRDFREFVAANALRMGLPEDTAAMFVVAAVEVFTNIIRHAKGLLPGAPVELIVHDTTEAFTLDIVHIGAEFTPPDEVEVADLSTFPEGGFGLTIIRSSCHCVDYLHHHGVNTVRMTRWLTPAS